jgi:hypothetical protein
MQRLVKIGTWEYKLGNWYIKVFFNPLNLLIKYKNNKPIFLSEDEILKISKRKYLISRYVKLPKYLHDDLFKLSRLIIIVQKKLRR